uniref:Rho-GAP domain-containing protein n=1 Tax=Glossina brevipalpis TaxID=37001 RepID=A0A1A9X2H6_9MUSC
MDVETTNFSELRDAEVAVRMRKCNYEKFKTLVRMHLSFELDLNTDEFDYPCHEIVYEDRGKLKKWNRMSKKYKHALMSGSTGCASSQKTVSGSNSISYSPNECPSQQIDAGFLFHLEEIKNFLMTEKNLLQEGIFRKNGSVSRQNELRSHIQNDSPLHLDYGDYSAHDCATVFKAYLSELSEPLLTDAHYPAHLQIAPLCLSVNANLEKSLEAKDSLTTSINGGKPPNYFAEKQKKELHVLNSMQLLFLLLPEENRNLLEHVIDILHAVALKQNTNKMTPDNLATLFTPHLICPRNLPPEALHYLVRKMSSIISYMIIKGREIFAVPPKLVVDIRAYFAERKRKKTASPEKALDESISDISTVNTVYTFVDRERTAAAHNTNTTDTELAQLYAHIQSLPESSKKRRLIKQFNKQNGQGTPLQLQAMNRLKNPDSARSSKSLSDSIKKHIFHKSIMSKTPKRQTLSTLSIETPHIPVSIKHKQRILFQSSTLVSNSSASAVTPGKSFDVHNSHIVRKCVASTTMLPNHEDQESSCSTSSSECSSSPRHALNCTDKIVNRPKSISAPVSRQSSSDLPNECGFSHNSLAPALSTSASLTALEPECFVTPLKSLTEAAKAVINCANIAGIDKKAVGWQDAQLLDTEQASNPSTPSQQFTTIAISNTKSRFKSEPNLSMCESPLPSATPTSVANVQEITPISKLIPGKYITRKLMKGVSMGNLRFPFATPESTKRLVRTVSSTLKGRNEDSHIYQRAEGSFLEAIKAGNVPLLADVDDDDENNDNEVIFENFINENARKDNDSQHLTKDPAVQQKMSLRRNLDLVTSTPSLLTNRRSMSPITKSTQRMSKAMQESIMTPRSRKPVMVLATAANCTDNNQGEEENSQGSSTKPQNLDVKKRALVKSGVNDGFTSSSGFSNILKRHQLLENNDSFKHLNLSPRRKSLEKNANTLSNDFKEYLMKRSVFTDAPEDSSFSSHSDDFDSTRELDDLEENQLSSSLLYCLDGNRPEERMNDGENVQLLNNNNTADSSSSSSSSIVINRLSNNPFVILNNARKRAASTEFDKAFVSISRKDKNDQKHNKHKIGNHFSKLSSEPSNKENFDHSEGYVKNKKYLISECPGETSF